MDKGSKWPIDPECYAMLYKEYRQPVYFIWYKISICRKLFRIFSHFYPASLLKVRQPAGHTAHRHIEFYNSID